MMAKALKCFKDAGDFDAAIHEWEARPVAAQTYANLKVVMCAEFSKLNWQDATTARATGHASANSIVEDLAEATEQLVANLNEQHSKQVEVISEKHAKQVETLIKANNEAMKELTAAILKNNKSSAAATGNTKSKGNCPHCNKKHRGHDKCWELPANEAKHPADWKSMKST
jgi:DNA repair exonuclease SbcCD ATPase subunit